MSAVFITTAPNICASCPRPIQAATRAVLNDRGEIVHLRCHETDPMPPKPRKRPAPKVCRKCWTIHTGECL